jgi:hypothetical protein
MPQAALKTKKESSSSKPKVKKTIQKKGAFDKAPRRKGALETKKKLEKELAGTHTKDIESIMAQRVLNDNGKLFFLKPKETKKKDSKDSKK